MEEKGQSKKQNIEQKPGELLFLIIFSAIVIALFIESVKLDGVFQGTNKGSGTIPQIIVMGMLVMICMHAVRLLKSKNWFRHFLSAEARRYLFSRNVNIMFVMILLYTLFLETLHFKLATFLFLFILMYILDPKRPLHKLIIAVGTVFCVVLIFGTIFEVALP